MRYLTLGEGIALHRAILESSGGASGIRDLGALESAFAQPRASFGGTELHPSLHTKAAALGFSLAVNSPFEDGNKRFAHAVMDVFLMMNGNEIEAGVDEQERLMIGLAAGDITRKQLVEWLAEHLRTRPPDQVPQEPRAQPRKRASRKKAAPNSGL
jgi:death-on-curing protein